MAQELAVPASESSVTNERSHMRPDKLQRLEESVNMTARKVLACVPLQELWTPAQIHGELARKGVHMGFNATEGSLHVLKDNRLVRCVDGRYQRVQASPTKLAAVPVVPSALEDHPVPSRSVQEPTVSTTETKPSDLMTRVENVAKLLRGAATEIENIALEYDRALQQAKTESAELQQLSALLKKFTKGE